MRLAKKLMDEENTGVKKPDNSPAINKKPQINEKVLTEDEKLAQEIQKQVLRILTVHDHI